VASNVEGAPFGATEPYSFDKQFNRVPGITRLEPEAGR